MKPAPFEYFRAQTVAEACAALASSDDARIIAGGQTLIPMLSMRLSRPALLVDISRVAALRSIEARPGVVAIGAATRQVEAERSALVAARLPLLARALPWVGHPPTRARGTVGGSIANADPSAEIPLVAVTLGADILIDEGDGAQPMLADDFFIGPMITACAEAGCVTEIQFPVWSGERVGAAFKEISARRSDFAFVSVAAQVSLDEAGGCEALAAGVGGAGDRPVALDLAGLVGTELGLADVEEAVRLALADLEAIDDLHASAAYRRRLAQTLTIRAIIEAKTDARRIGEEAA
jgi:CO/xanthine dehydrogenase FAD-binding subunit